MTELFPGFVAVDDVGLPSIVDLLSLLDHSVRSSTTPIRLVTVAELSELRGLLEVAICEVIQPKGSGETKGPTTKDGLFLPWKLAHRFQALSAADPARKFWKWMEEANNQRQDSVALISTNYDTSIEQMISENLTFERISEQVDFGVSWRDPDREEAYPRPVSPWLRLYKLHGSLNWLRCDLCEHMYLNYAWDIYVRVLDPEVSDINSCHCGHGRLSLMLVTPSYVRDVREPNLLGIWRDALELLRTSDAWVIVGYSLPSDDISIRSMLTRAAQGRVKLPRITVVLDRNRPEILARYSLLFADYRAYLLGFGAYINELSSVNENDVLS